MRGNHSGNEAGGLIKAYMIWNIRGSGKELAFYPEYKGGAWEFPIKI